MEKRNGVFGIIRELDYGIAMATLTVLIFVTVLGVFMRYFVNRPLTWLEEVQLWLLVWIVFFGGSAVTRRFGHIAIDAFVGLFPQWLRKFSIGICNAVTAIVMGFLFYFALRHVMQMYTSGRVTNILHIPYWLIYISVPICCVVTVVFSIGRLFHFIPEIAKDDPVSEALKGDE